MSPTGLTVPLPVLELAWDLEARGFDVTVGAENALSVEPRHTLTLRDRLELERWEKHLAALTVFCDEMWKAVGRSRLGWTDFVKAPFDLWKIYRRYSWTLYGSGRIAQHVRR